MHTLESTWALETSIEPVWQTLSAVEQWPAWWPVVGSLERLTDGDDYGVGACYRVNGKLELRICEANAPHLLEFSTRHGLARWTLHEEEGISLVHLSLWGYSDEPMFARAMSAGANGLARHLKVRLIEAGSWSAVTDQVGLGFTAGRLEEERS